MSIEDRIARGSIIISAGSIASLIVASLGSIVIARILGPDNYGLIPVIMITPNVLMVLSDLGLGTALTRYSSMDSPKRSSYIITGLILKTALGVLASLVLWIAAGYIALTLKRPYAEFYIRISSLLVLANSIVSASTAALIGLGGYIESTLIMIALTVLRVLVGAGLVILGFGVLGALLGHIVAWSVFAIIAAVILLQHLGSLAKPIPKIALEMLAYSIPLYLPTLIGIPLSQFYYSILARVSTNWELGNLGVANNILAPINSIGGAISVSLLSSLPLLLGDMDSLSRITWRSVTYTSLIMPALAGGVIVVAEPLITLLYGSSYSLSPLYVMIAALGIMLAPLGSYVWTSYLAALGRTLDIFKVQVLGALLGIPLYITLILTAGVIGYIASGIIVSLVTTSYALYIVRNLGIRVYLGESLRMLSPTIIALTTTTPMLLTVENTIAKWILAPTTYTIVLAIVTPPIAGSNTLLEITTMMRRTGFLGALIATMINIDVKIAEKIWGLEGGDRG